MRNSNGFCIASPSIDPQSASRSKQAELCPATLTIRMGVISLEPRVAAGQLARRHVKEIDPSNYDDGRKL